MSSRFFADATGKSRRSYGIGTVSTCRVCRGVQTPSQVRDKLRCVVSRIRQELISRSDSWTLHSVNVLGFLEFSNNMKTVACLYGLLALTVQSDTVTHEFSWNLNCKINQETTCMYVIGRRQLSQRNKNRCEYHKRSFLIHKTPGHSTDYY